MVAPIILSEYLSRGVTRFVSYLESMGDLEPPALPEDTYPCIRNCLVGLSNDIEGVLSATWNAIFKNVSCQTERLLSGSIRHLELLECTLAQTPTAATADTTGPRVFTRRPARAKELE